MDVDVGAVWSPQVPEGPGSHDQPWLHVAQCAVADDIPPLQVAPRYQRRGRYWS